LQAVFDKLSVIDVSESTVPNEVHWLPICPLLLHSAPRHLKDCTDLADALKVTSEFADLLHMWIE
jgi:hypothetical protein